MESHTQYPCKMHVKACHGQTDCQVCVCVCNVYRFFSSNLFVVKSHISHSMSTLTHERSVSAYNTRNSGDSRLTIGYSNVQRSVVLCL